MNEIRCSSHLVSILVLVAPLLAAPGTAQAQAELSPLLERIEERLEASRESLVEVRRDLHRHPEVSGEERRTSGIVATRLRDLGFTVRTEVGGHGVIGVLRGAKTGPVVAFRADMDAVPSDAPDPVDYRSETPGVRHICGHDIHTTIGLALAEAFAAIRQDLPGSLMLLFQPAEESATGARAMLADGAFADTVPDAIYAVHTAPYSVGQIATTPDGMMASRDRVAVEIRGAGDLEATANEVQKRILALGTVPPEAAVQPATDPDFLLVQARDPRPEDGGRHYVFHATLTNASETARRNAEAGVERALSGIDHEGVTLSHSYTSKAIAGVTNDPALTKRAVEIARAQLGEASVIDLTTVVPAFSEDFGSFQDEVPGVMFFLGVSNPEKGWVGMPHSPGYVADDESIVVGARVMAAILLDRALRSTSD